MREVCGDTSATSAGTDFKLNHVYIGEMVPPLERFERREEPKAQGGEFVEAYVAHLQRPPEQSGGLLELFFGAACTCFDDCEFNTAVVCATGASAVGIDGIIWTISDGSHRGGVYTFSH